MKPSEVLVLVCTYVFSINSNAKTERLLFRQEKCAQYWPSDGSVVHGDISIEIKREEENESYTVRDLLVTNNRVRNYTPNVSAIVLVPLKTCLELFFFFPGEQGSSGASVSFPRLARGGHPHRR